jgi:hypothetical protein
MPSVAQRMFHGQISAAALAQQLAATFQDRQRRTFIQNQGETCLVQIGSKHGTPVTIHVTDTIGGVLVTMGRDRNWLDKVGDVSELIERAASNPISLLALLPDLVGEFGQENITPQIWDSINDICALTLSLAGESKAPKNPKICEFCGKTNDATLESCEGCGANLTTDLPRKCPKCEMKFTSDALFCQACGTRLVIG